MALAPLTGGGGGRHSGPVGGPPLPAEADGSGGQHGRAAETLVAFRGGSGWQQAGGRCGSVALSGGADPELLVSAVSFARGGPQHIGGGRRYELLLAVAFTVPLPAPSGKGAGPHPTGGAAPEVRVSAAEAANIEPTSTTATMAATWVFARASAAGILDAIIGPLRRAQGKQG